MLFVNKPCYALMETADFLPQFAHKPALAASPTPPWLWLTAWRPCGAARRWAPSWCSGGIAGILSSWNGFLIGASRLIYAMAESGMLPAWFGKLHPKYKTPMNALIFIGGLSVLAPVLRPADAGVVG